MIQKNRNGYKCHACRTWLAAFVFALTLPVFSSCSGDDNGKTASANVNANNAQVFPEYARMEMPHIKDGSRIIIHRTDAFGVNYIVEWDDGLRAQRWTCYRLDPDNSVKKGSRSGWWHGKDPFAEDELIPAAYRTTLTDYSQMTPHYDRGHICPSADRRNSKEANRQTYLLGNIQPQLNGFNAGVWLYMENKIHGNSYDNIKGWNNTAFRDTLYICKGGTIDNNNYTRSNTGLVIPKYFFAAILRVKNGQYNALGLWFEHKNDHSTSLKAYACSIDELEKRTGIDFFCNLPDDRERVIEAAQPNDALWGLK